LFVDDGFRVLRSNDKTEKKAGVLPSVYEVRVFFRLAGHETRRGKMRGGCVAGLRLFRKKQAFLLLRIQFLLGLPQTKLFKTIGLYIENYYLYRSGVKRFKALERPLWRRPRTGKRNVIVSGNLGSRNDKDECMYKDRKYTTGKPQQF